MKEFVGKVVSMTTYVGDIIGEVSSVDRNGVFKVLNPRLFMRDNQGAGQLVPTVNGSSVDYPEFTYMSVSCFICITEANSSVVKAWQNSLPENSSKIEKLETTGKIIDVEGKKAPAPLKPLKRPKTKVIDIDV